MKNNGRVEFRAEATFAATFSAETDNRCTIVRDRDGGKFYLKRIDVGRYVEVGAKGELVEVISGFGRNRTSRTTFEIRETTS